ncbi:MAG: formylglycine-generating enzyme family protein [Rhodospirillaceae bacterium]|nr:formylglycine-generating enzyme family protein [Rhodospirillaceae bacterium]
MRFFPLLLSVAAVVNLAGCASSGGPTKAFRDCANCPDMVRVAGGTFQMGSDRVEEMRADETRPEGPIRTVTIKRAFALGKYEVTNAQFRQFINATGYRPSAVCNTWVGKEALAVMDWRNPGHSKPPAENEPVVCASWYDAKAYVAWLSGVTGKLYRLPTEAEWEYAAKAGSSTTWPWGEDETQACKYMNTYDLDAKDKIPPERAVRWEATNCRDGFAEAAPVGSFPANAFGLHDMLGNVWEWNEDCSPKLYAAKPDDGSAYQHEKLCDMRSVRGGSWQTRQSRNRPTFRGRDPELRASHIFGFRVARDLD